MELSSLLTDLSTLPSVVLVGDPDGEIERAAFALLPHDGVGAARLALTIQNAYRRAVWLRGFRPATIAAAERAGLAVDANTARAGRLAGAFDSVAPAAGTGQPAASPTTSAANGAPSDEPIVAALNAAKDAIVGALNSVQNATKDVSAAVRSSNGKFAS